MQFCKECGNMLLPKKKKNVLYCRVCEKDFPVGKAKSKISDYKKLKKSTQKKKEKERALRTTIVTVDDKQPSISKDEREAFREMLSISDEGF